MYLKISTPINCSTVLLGHTTDFAEMVNSLLKKYPTTNIVATGFSLGGNLITKYLGEEMRPANVIGGVSICQGYDAVV